MIDCLEIRPGIFLLQSEKDFNSALETWSDMTFAEIKKEFGRVLGKPGKYPCVVSFAQSYDGDDYISTLTLYPEDALRLINPPPQSNSSKVIKYQPNRDVKPPEYQIVSEGYNPF